jgi:hypothetical protein
LSPDKPFDDFLGYSKSEKDLEEITTSIVNEAMSGKTTVSYATDVNFLDPGSFDVNGVFSHVSLHIYIFLFTFAC